MAPHKLDNHLVEHAYIRTDEKYTLYPLMRISASAHEPNGTEEIHRRKQRDLLWYADTLLAAAAHWDDACVGMTSCSASECI